MNSIDLEDLKKFHFMHKLTLTRVFFQYSCICSIRLIISNYDTLEYLVYINTLNTYKRYSKYSTKKTKYLCFEYPNKIPKWYFEYLKNVFMWTILILTKRCSNV